MMRYKLEIIGSDGIVITEHYDNHSDAHAHFEFADMMSKAEKTWVILRGKTDDQVFFHVQSMGEDNRAALPRPVKYVSNDGCSKKGLEIPHLEITEESLREIRAQWASAVNGSAAARKTIIGLIDTIAYERGWKVD